MASASITTSSCIWTRTSARPRASLPPPCLAPGPAPPPAASTASRSCSTTCAKCTRPAPRSPPGCDPDPAAAVLAASTPQPCALLCTLTTFSRRARPRHDACRVHPDLCDGHWSHACAHAWGVMCPRGCVFRLESCLAAFESWVALDLDEHPSTLQLLVNRPFFPAQRFSTPGSAQHLRSSQACRLMQHARLGGAARPSALPRWSVWPSTVQPL